MKDINLNFDGIDKSTIPEFVDVFLDTRAEPDFISGPLWSPDLKRHYMVVGYDAEEDLRKCAANYSEDNEGD